MPKQLIDHVNPAPTGDTPKSGAVKVNSNFDEVYAALDTKAASTVVTDHVALADPHTQYQLETAAVTLSDSTPLVDTVNATPGTAATAARADHRHSIGGVWHQRFAAGGYYGAYNNALSNTAQATGVLHATPFFVPFTRAFDRILINVATAGVGPVRLGIYGDTGSAYPGGLVLSAGTVDSAVLGEQLIIISQSLNPGMYWLAALTETTTNAAITSANGTTLGMRNPAAAVAKGYQATAVAAGALPATYPAGITPDSTATIRVLLRAA